LIPEVVKKTIQTQYRAFLSGNDFAPRSGQRQMIASIAQTLWHSSHSNICAIEAGTGTGKTLAYLLPALATARQQGKQLVVATATVALQEQLISKDLPTIKKLGDMDFTYALVKGRGRYACNLKLDQIAGSSGNMPIFNDPEFRPSPLYNELRDELIAGTWDGDRDHWSDAIAERDWRPLIADRYQCLNRRCPMISECVFYKAREELAEVDCLVTNQDLFLSDLQLGGGVILPSPEDAIYVFDEAHHLVSKARNHFSTMARLSSANSLIEQIAENISRLQEDARSTFVGKLPGETLAVVEILTPLQADLSRVMEEKYKESFALSVRFAHGDVDEDIREPCARLAEAWRRCAGQLENLVGKLEFSDGDSSDLKGMAVEWGPIVGQIFARAGNLAQAWQAFSEKSSEPTARWIDIDHRRGDFTLRTIPLRPGEKLKSSFWNQVSGAVLTSATLTAMGSFESIMDGLSLPDDTHTLAIQSPFDFAGRGQLVIPQGCPEAGNTQAHDEFLEEYLPEAITEVLGTLVLFSSDRQMQHLAERVLDTAEVPILVQGTYSKQEILRRHRERVDMGEASVIFGLASFAEGIDLPGEYCSHVIIAKIPFPVPDDPVIESLGEWVESQGRNAFSAVMLPEASLALIQAVGRLMRSETDSGRVTILDRRLVSKGYGKRLLNSLPAFSRNLGD
jgi:ATP-dependent DNA helicase DinG